MALAENPSPGQLQHYFDAAVTNRHDDVSGYDFNEWRRVNTRLYEDNTVIGRIGFFLSEHSLNWLHLAMLLDSVEFQFGIMVGDVIAELHTLSNKDILTIIDKRLKNT